jgi:hypothetical protein
VHTVQFVHKNIRPETIIVFQNKHSHIGASLLAGFEQFLIENGNTYRAGGDVWQYNLCKISHNFAVIMLTSSLPNRHPSRQGTHPQVDYQTQHDIYSLGVVLLEIGLWTLFALYGLKEESSSSVPNKILEPADIALSEIPSARVSKQAEARRSRRQGTTSLIRETVY